MNSGSHLRIRLAGTSALAVALCAGVAPALAQVPTVDPGGAQPAEPAPTPAPATAPAPRPVIIPLQEGETMPGSEGGGDTGYYHYDDYMGAVEPDDREGGERAGAGYGPVPEFHVVRRGDTLWDICWFYFNNPWEWPKIWSYNPAITNPHWIYPGDLVRLYPQGMTPVIETSTEENLGDIDAPIQAAPLRRTGVSLRQIAFVDKDELRFAATIDGAVEEKAMLSTGDDVYLAYQGAPPKVGARYAVYTERDTVKHPDDGRVVGSYVRILGELEVVSVKKGKRARARITDAVDVIERGALVGPLQRTYKTVEPTRNERDLTGTIIAVIGPDQLIGQGQVVFVDTGSRQGVEPGNRMYVVRRGDAYEKVMGPSGRTGQDDRRFPARALGEILIVQTGRNVAVGLVTLALQELGVGDHTVMRASR